MFGQFLADELNKRNNPKDMKESLYGVVTKHEPFSVAIEGGGGVLVENEELFISESFRLRCNIDKTKALSTDVTQLLQNARAITETHSNGGAPCGMPQAIDALAQAIEKIQTELMQFRCDLNEGDRVVLAPHKEEGKYILVEKVLNDVPE